jgi:RNA polymerase sigma-70 factor (sigma-E family)
MTAMTVPIERAARTGEQGEVLSDLYREHYRSLVRLAYLMLGDQGRSEEIVQDAFVKLQLHWRGLRDPEKAPAYLRRAVLNGARSALRHRKVVARHDARRTAEPASTSPEAATLAGAEHERLIAALRRLPDRQREALALRFYLDLSEAEMASAMKVSPGSVKTHLHRGLAALGRLLDEDAA